MAAPSEQFQDEPQAPAAIPLGPPAEDNGSQQVSQEEEAPPLAPGEQLQPEEPPPPPYVPPPYRGAPTATKFSISGPISEMASAAQQMRPPAARQYRPPVKEEPEVRQAARDYLDELVRDPQAVDWVLRVHRTGPPLWDRGKGEEPVKRGLLLTTPVVDYDSLYTEIVAYWGGGDYRIAVMNGSGEYVSGKVSLNIKIPCHTYPPKFSKMEMQGEAREEPAFPATPREETEFEKEARRLEEETKLANLQTRKEAAQLERETKELTLLQRKRDNARLRRELSAPDAEANPIDKVLDRIEAQREKDREEARRQLERVEAAAKSDREAFEKKFETLLAKMAEKPREDSPALLQAVKDAAAASERSAQNLVNTIIPLMKKDDGAAVKDMIVAMQSSNAQMFTALATATAPRGDAGKEIRELVAGNQAQMTDLFGKVVTAIAPRQGGELSEGQKAVLEANKMVFEATQSAAKRESAQDRTLMNTLIQAIMQPKSDGMTPDMVLRLIGEGRKQMREGLEFAQSMNPPELEPVSVPDADGYDTKAGVLGNLGKALYIGLKTAFQTASQHPEMLQPLLNYLGRRTAPTDEDLMATAHGMEMARTPQLPGVQQQVMIPMRPQYQMPAPVPPMGPSGPIITPVPPGMRPVPVQPMGAPRPPQPVGVQPAQPQPVGVQPAPTPPSVAANPPMQAAPPGPPTANQPPAAVEQAVASELEGDASGVAAPNEEGEEEETPEERLKYFVTQTMREALTNVTDRQNKHTWPLDAFEYWNGHFKDALAAEPVMDRRVEMIRNNCDDAVWQPLDTALNTIDGGKQIVSFREAVESLVQMHKTHQGGGKPEASLQ